MGAPTKEKITRFIHRFWSIGIIIALWVVFSWPYIARGRVPFPSTYLVTFFAPWNASYTSPVKNNAMPDVITQIFPWKKLTIDSWKTGSVPLWNPYSFSGTPQAANYQSAVFSLVNLLFFIFPFLDAWTIMIILQPLVAGFGMYVFMRSSGRSKPGSVVASIGFMFCGFITTWMAYGTLGYAVAFLPWAFWTVNRSFQSKSFWPGIALSLFVALSFVSGHFQISLYVAGSVLCFILAKTLSSRQVGKGLLSSICVLSGILIAAPQLLLTFDAYRVSTRSASFIKGEVIPWPYLITLFSPDFFGNPVTRNDWFGHYAEWGSYIGIIPLILMFIGIRKKASRYIWFFVTLGISAIMLAYPTPVNDLLFSLKLPALSTSAASRIIVLLSFSIAVISAFGFDQMTEYWKTGQKKVFLTIAGIFLLFVGIVWVLLLSGGGLDAGSLMIAQRNMILPTILGIAACACLFAGFNKFRNIRLMMVIGLISIASFDSYRFATKWMPADPEEFVYPPVRSLTFLSSVIGNNRVFGNIGNEAGGMFSFPLIEGYDAMYQGRYAEFISALSRGKVSSGVRSVVQFDKNAQYKTEGLQLLGIRYIYHRISDGMNVWAFPYWEYLKDSSMRSIYRDEQYEIFEYTKAYPRVFMASSYRVETENQKIIDTLFAGGFNRLETVVLEKKPALEPKPGSWKAEIVSYKANTVQITTESETPKLLFLSDVFDPGWRAYVDGKNTEIYRADYDFRAVAVPSGAHIVEFSYMPRLFLWGIVCSLTGLLGLLGISVIVWKKYENRII